VWRVAGFGRAIAAVVAGVPALMAVVLWIGAVVELTGEAALAALAVTGVAVVYGLSVWWVALRPKLVLTDDEVVTVNPWGTQRIALDDVVGASPGLFGARLHLRDGWSITTFALSQAYSGFPDRGRRVAQVREAVLVRQRALGVR
jgi:hypothetical protein